METMSVGEFKAQFSAVLKKVIAGQEIAICYGRNKEIVARLVPKQSEKKQRRTLGILKQRGSVQFRKDFEITDEEFLGV